MGEQKIKKNGEKIIIRFYASYDADLINLLNIGIPLAGFARQVLTDYVNGQDTRYVVPHISPSQTDINSTCRTFFRCEDERILHLLHCVKEEKRNQFIKSLMRNALVRQNLVYFFDDTHEGKRLSALENDRNETYGEPYVSLDLFRTKRSLARILKKRAIMPVTQFATPRAKKSEVQPEPASATSKDAEKTISVGIKKASGHKENKLISEISDVKVPAFTVPKNKEPLPASPAPEPADSAALQEHTLSQTLVPDVDDKGSKEDDADIMAMLNGIQAQFNF